MAITIEKTFEWLSESFLSPFPLGDVQLRGVMQLCLGLTTSHLAQKRLLGGILPKRGSSLVLGLELDGVSPRDKLGLAGVPGRR